MTEPSHELFRRPCSTCLDKQASTRLVIKTSHAQSFVTFHCKKCVDRVIAEMTPDNRAEQTFEVVTYD